MKNLHIYFDGGTIHGSFKVFEEQVSPESLIEHRVYNMTGIADSNQAEFTVLLRALRWICWAYPDQAECYLYIYGDNALVKNMIGKKTENIWKGELSTQPDFTFLTKTIRERLDRFAGFEYQRLRRQLIIKMLGH